MVNRATSTLHRPDGARGLVLVDVLCAYAIFAALVAVAWSGHSGHRIRAIQELDQTRASYLAWSLLEQAKVAAATGTLTAGHQPVDPALWHLPPVLEATAEWSAEPLRTAGTATPADLWSVSARVSWQPRGGRRRTEVTDHTTVFYPSGGHR